MSTNRQMPPQSTRKHGLLQSVQNVGFPKMYNLKYAINPVKIVSFKTVHCSSLVELIIFIY